MELHDKLDSGAEPDTAHPNTFVVYGDRRVTDVAVRYNFKEKSKDLTITPVRRRDGDGTVAKNSARAFFPNQSEMPLSRHFRPDKDPTRLFVARLGNSIRRHTDIFRLDDLHPFLGNLLEQLAKQKAN